MIELLIGLISTIVELVLSFIAPFLIWTGEMVIGILSFGYHRPEINREAFRGDNAWLPIKHYSFWVGIVFWVGFGVIWKFYFS